MKNKNELLEEANKTLKFLSKDLSPDELVNVLAYARCIQQGEVDVTQNFRMNVLTITGPRYETVRSLAALELCE